MATGAYFMGTVSDRRDECRMVPNRDATDVGLANIHVKILSIEMTSEWEAHLNEMAKTYAMKNRDEIHISRAAMPDFDEKMKVFFEEHLHRDAEVRFVYSGTGYFDVRSVEDQWIRIPVKSGDFLYLPAGIYHRFTTDWNENLVAIRFFRTAPRWEAFFRCKNGDLLEERKVYLKSITAGNLY